MASLGNLVVSVGMDTSSFTRGFTSMNNMMTKGKLRKGSTPGAGNLGRMGASGGGGGFGSITNSVVAANLLTKALTVSLGLMTDMVKQSILLAANAEQTKLTFEVLSGSKSVGEALFGEMKTIARDTSLSLEETTMAAKQLLVTFDATQIPHLVKMLGNISSGLSNVSLSEMAYLLQTSAEEGKLLARDLRQFTTRGIAMPKALKEVLGLFGPGSSQKLNAMISAGQVGFDKVMLAVEKLGSTDMLSRQGKTLKGRFTQMLDAASFVLMDFGEMFIQAFDVKATIESVTTYIRGLGDNMWKLKTIIQAAADTFWKWVSVASSIGTQVVDALSSTAGMAAVMSVGIFAAAGALSIFLGFLLPVVPLLLGMAALAGVLWVAFEELFTQLSEDTFSWGEIFTVVFATVGFLADNWKDVMYLAFLTVNAGLHAFAGGFMHMFTEVLPAYLAHFSKNSGAAWDTMLDYLLTALINTGQNIRNFFTELWDYIWSGGDNAFDFVKIDMLEGAVNSLPPMEAIPDRILTDYEEQMRQEIATLSAALGAGYTGTIQTALEERQAAKAPGAPPKLGDRKPFNFDSPSGGTEAKTGLMQGTQDAWTAIMGSMKDEPVVEAVKAQTRQQKEDAKELRKFIKQMNKANPNLNLVVPEL